MSIDADPRAELLTITEAAEYLRVSVPTVRRLAAQRQMSFIKVRGSVRFTRDDVDSYLERQRVRAIDQHNQL
jgi:excisionase family DNA binding protein